MLFYNIFCNTAKRIIFTANFKLDSFNKNYYNLK